MLCLQDHKEVLKRVRKIELKTRRLVDGLVQGAYYSVFKGRGIEFSEIREYQIGDDIRTIDWNVTARMNKPFIKEFVEERDLNIIIVFDISASNNFGSGKLYKKEIVVELSATIAFSAIRNNDNVGLILSTDKVEKYIPPKKGKSNVLRLIREMIYFSPEGKRTDLEDPIKFMSKVLKKRSVIFIISDFYADLDRIEKPLKFLGMKHDVIGIRIYDPRESEMPDVGFIELEDEETGEQLLVDTSDEDFRERFRDLSEQKGKEIFKRFQRNKIDMIGVSTAEDWSGPLMSFFKNRARKMS